jgi:Protein of unknown function (DUF3105)
MSSRQEEKERRRQERLEAEQKAASAARSKRRLQMVGGVLLVAVIAVVGVVLATSSGGSDGDKAPDTGNLASVAIPEPGENASADRLTQAAEEAGCELKNFSSEGRDHSSKPGYQYKTNPPTSGTHNPTPAQDGVYEPGNEPEPENAVHTLEHGRIIIQYKPGTPKRTIDQLETLFNEEVQGTRGYHEVLMQNNTEMPYAVAATAWTHLLGCKTFTPKAFDAIRAFRARYVDKGPELIP